MGRVLLLAATVLLVAGAGSAHATTPGICFAITGLAPGDALNLREAPGPTARIVGRFNSLSAGVIAKAGRCQRWCRVAVYTGDGSYKGWMHSRYLERRECP